MGHASNRLQRQVLGGRLVHSSERRHCAFLVLPRRFVFVHLACVLQQILFTLLSVNIPPDARANEIGPH